MHACPHGARLRLAHGGSRPFLLLSTARPLTARPFASPWPPDVPLVIASVRAGITPAACAPDDRVREELECLRADLTHGSEGRIHNVERSTPAGVTRGVQT